MELIGTLEEEKIISAWGLLSCGSAPVDDCLSYSFWCSVVYCQPHVFTPFYTIDKTDKKTYTFSGGLSFVEIGLLLLSRGGAL